MVWLFYDRAVGMRWREKAPICCNLDCAHDGVTVYIGGAIVVNELGKLLAIKEKISR